jgi:hypothetical protein
MHLLLSAFLPIFTITPSTEANLENVAMAVSDLHDMAGVFATFGVTPEDVVDEEEDEEENEEEIAGFDLTPDDVVDNEEKE